MIFSSKEYNTELNIRIDWSELDLFGHINNVAFFKYIQTARVNYWDQIGLTHSFRDFKKGPMLLSASCQFKKPLFYPGNIKIMTKVDFIKNSSFGLTHLILDDDNDVAAIGQDIVVYYDYNTNHKIGITDDIRNIIEEREKRHFTKD